MLFNEFCSEVTDLVHGAGSAVVGVHNRVTVTAVKHYRAVGMKDSHGKGQGCHWAMLNMVFLTVLHISDRA